MHVVHVIAGLGVGGAELMLHRLAATSARGSEGLYRHTVISLGEVGVVGELMRAEGVAVEALGMRTALQAPIVLWRLRNRLRALAPNVVQTWMYHADLLGGLAARLAGIPRVIWGIRTSTMVKGTSRSTAFVRWLCARLSAQVPAVIVCAAEAARRVHEEIGYDARRMVVIPNGFELPESPSDSSTRELRAGLGWTGDEVVVGTVGRFDPYKDYATFVAASALVAKREPRARFLMIGRGLDQGNAELTGWIARAGLAERFVLLGGRSDVNACLAAMDVFVLPSRSEGFPNVVGEAMAAGVPCAVTDVGDAALLVGDTGEVARPLDAASLAAAIGTLLAMPAAERRARGARGRERIRAEFSMDRARERFLAVHARVAAMAPA